jgi:hypothetical protein
VVAVLAAGAVAAWWRTRGASGEHAELYFEACMWPDFGEAELRKAVREFSRRERRFGRVPAAAAS